MVACSLSFNLISYIMGKYIPILVSPFGQLLHFVLLTDHYYVAFLNAGCFMDAMSDSERGKEERISFIG